MVVFHLSDFPLDHLPLKGKSRLLRGSSMWCKSYTRKYYWTLENISLFLSDY
ncbi:hypothetical protein Lalb_Chr10g0099141 [Lupinus albus]|uniref:Uncharacterized protein n=1 Tax=Lupinus albus TaxID=3870 RepID=A0A6A4PW73_LUPAL|nr:hypothetical protein Lalb_Chr10g0099141 [Lupinus albus]